MYRPALVVASVTVKFHHQFTLLVRKPRGSPNIDAGHWVKQDREGNILRGKSVQVDIIH